jgi:hypothetical protein
MEMVENMVSPDLKPSKQLSRSKSSSSLPKTPSSYAALKAGNFMTPNPARISTTQSQPTAQRSMFPSLSTLKYNNLRQSLNSTVSSSPLAKSTPKRPILPAEDEDEDEEDDSDDSDSDSNAIKLPPNKRAGATVRRR